MVHKCMTTWWNCCDRLLVGCSVSPGVHWLGAWWHSVHPSSRPEISKRRRAHTHTAEGDSIGGANPTRLARPSAWCALRGNSDRAARGNVVLAQAALGR